MTKILKKNRFFDLSNPWIATFKFLLIFWVMSIPFKNAVYQISTALIILFFLVYLFRIKNIHPLFENLNKTKILSLIFLFIVATMVISNFINPNFINAKSWEIIIMLIVRYALLFVILAYFYRLNFFSKNFILFLIISSFSLLSLTAIFEIINDLDSITNVAKGLAGSRGNRASFGIMIGIGASYCMCLYLKNKIVSFMLFFYFSFFLIFSFARTAWVGIFFAAIVFFIINYKNFSKKDKKIFLFTAILILLIVVLLFFSVDSFNTRFNSLLKGESSSRLDIWKYSFNAFLNQPYLGYGINSFGNLPNNIFYPHTALTPHNLILELFLEVGLVGFVLCMSFIFVVFKELYNHSIFLPVGAFMFVSFLFNGGIFSSKDFLSLVALLTFLAYSHRFKESV